MAVENGYGAELEMVVDEDNHDVSGDNNKNEIGNDCTNIEKKITTEATVIMEVVEVPETDPLGDSESEDRVITASVEKKADNENQRVTETATLEKADSKEDLSVLVPEVKIKEELDSEVVLIDSEDEKEEKTKVKVTGKNMQLRQNPKPVTNYRNYVNSTHSKNNSDFQIVSVDDDSPMNKNDPMNVFLCSTEEREFRKDYFKDPSSNVLKQRLHCTICDIHIGACPQNSKNMVCHRFLKVLICRKCANFYGQGEFPQDEGSDEFCRWCGEGGEVFLCNSCSNVFCQPCILRNFGMQEVKRVDRLANWDCYVCDPRPLWTLRAIAFALFTYVRRIKVVAYRNGMYQTINSTNTKVSKSDLMALETDLSTCCPKEVKAAAAAASASASSPRDVSNSTSNSKPSPSGSNAVNKVKDSNFLNQSGSPRTVPTTSKANSNVPTTVANVYNSSRPSSSKRAASKSNSKAVAPSQPWQQDHVMSQYLPGSGKKVPVQNPFVPVVFSSQQSTLRSALVDRPANFMQTFSGQNILAYGEAGSDARPENGVLQWFNGILTSLMDTMKNIENRLVFIRNSTSNLISQNEVSFLVNQLHNLLKVSSSKMQEVDCDLLKNYKEFIDKSEITVNDFDDIVREYPEFFKSTESSQEPEIVTDEPDLPEDINPMALVEVIEEGDQQTNGEGSSKRPDADSVKCGSTTSSKRDSSDNSIEVVPCSVVIKKEAVSGEEEIEAHPDRDDHKNTGAAKRKSGVKNSQNGVKKLKRETINIKQESVQQDHVEGTNKNGDLEQSHHMKKCTVKLTDVTVNAAGPDREQS